MNILKAAPAYYPAVAFGGPVFKTKAIAENLSQRGHTVSVVAPNLLDMERKLSAQTVTEEVNGVQVTYLQTWVKYRWVSFNPEIISFCRKHLHRFDVIHTYGFYDLLSPAVAYFARKLNVPYIVEPLGMYVPILRSFGKKRLYHALFGRRLIGGAARIIATSEQERTELIEAGCDSGKIDLRRNGIDLSLYADLPQQGLFRQRFRIDPDEQIILYLSRLSPKKSPDMLLKAFAGLDVPKTKLVIAGPGEGDGYPEQLQQLAAQLDLGERVIFPGPLYDEQKLTAYVDAHVFVLPSQSENFGNVVAEACAAGTPVIVTDRCGIAPYVRDRAGLVIPYDLCTLGKALDRLLSDADLHAYFRDQCPKVARQLSWDEPIVLMEEIYKGVISGEPHVTTDDDGRN